MTNIANEITNKPTILYEFNAQPVTAPLVSGRLPIWRLKLWRETPAKFQSAASRVRNTESKERDANIRHLSAVMWFPPGYRFCSVEFSEGKEPFFRPQSKALNLVRKRWSTSPESTRVITSRSVNNSAIFISSDPRAQGIEDPRYISMEYLYN